VRASAGMAVFPGCVGRHFVTRICQPLLPKYLKKFTFKNNREFSSRKTHDLRTNRRRRGEIKMQRAMSILSIYLLVLATTPVMAATSGAHFMSSSASVSGTGALVVSWDESGLGNENVTYTLTANATATYACINGGSKHPSAANKETASAQVSAGGSFQAKNGRVQASLTTGPLSAGSFTCPNGQTLVLANVSYTTIVLTDTTNNVASSLSDQSSCIVSVKGIC
jgi:hypothetical protein